MNRRQMLRAALAPAVVLGVGTGCSEPQPKPGSVDVADPGSVAATPPSASPTSSLPTGPLTGAPVGTPAAATRQAVAVPMRVSPATTPAGLDAADLVYAEFAESDTLHLTAVFHSRDASKIGPVTEIRPVDIRSVSVLRPFVGYDGGPTGFLSQFESSDLDGVTPDDDGKVFSGDYTSTAALLKAAPKGVSRPRRRWTTPPTATRWPPGTSCPPPSCRSPSPAARRWSGGTTSRRPAGSARSAPRR